jgi:hypothetical protein
MSDPVYDLHFARGTVYYLLNAWVANPAFRPDTTPIMEGMYLAQH